MAEESIAYNPEDPDGRCREAVFERLVREGVSEADARTVLNDIEKSCEWGKALHQASTDVLQRTHVLEHAWVFVWHYAYHSSGSNEVVGTFSMEDKGLTSAASLNSTLRKGEKFDVCPDLLKAFAVGQQS